MEIKTKLAEYLEARHAYEELRAIASDAERKSRALEQELVDAMIENGVPKFSLDNGISVSLRQRFDCAVNQENGQLVEDWLQETTGDVTKFQKQVLYKPAVVAYLKEGIESGSIDQTSVPQFLNLRTTPGIQVRGLNAMVNE